MSFVRPEAAAHIRRWREALVGAAVWTLGMWWAIWGQGLMPYIGMPLVVIGAFLFAAGLQRGRFRIAGKGPGIVQVTEDQITYFGPLSGGTIALADLTRLAIDGAGKPGHWVLSQPGQPDLFIPTTAEGAEALFDAFARLPGLRTEAMLTRLKDGKSSTIWSAKDLEAPVKRLH